MTPENFRVQFLRGTTVENDDYTGRDGELTVDHEQNQMRLHDGVTMGGHVLGNGQPLTDIDLGELPSV